MIASVFLVALVIGSVALAVTGGPGLPVLEIGLLAGLLVLFFAAGVYVAATLGILALIAGFAFSDRPFWTFIGQIVWNPSNNFVLVSIPLFLLMGEILLRAGLSEKLYRALNVWTGRIPGGLLHTNILSCAVFSAISGSSVATAATMGSVALPYFEKTRYSQRMVLGSLCAGGALGNLIPPGISFIVYGLLTETSVGKLYIAAIVPSAIVTGLFLLVILGHALLWGEGERAPTPTAAEKWRSLVDLLPTAILILVVLGTIYGGVATPTEAAALGVTGALVFAALDGRLTFRLVDESATTTAVNTAMLGLIIFGAYLLNFLLSALRVPQELASFVAALPLPPWAIMAVIIGFYLALGTFMEGFSMIITTIPVIFPLVKALGYDPIWFGVIVTMLVEIAMISPPDGTVMYVLQGLRPSPGPITDVFVGVTPFVTIYILAVAILTAWPELALWLVRAWE